MSCVFNEKILSNAIQYVMECSTEEEKSKFKLESSKFLDEPIHFSSAEIDPRIIVYRKCIAIYLQMLLSKYFIRFSDKEHFALIPAKKLSTIQEGLDKGLLQKAINEAEFMMPLLEGLL